ncbi:hypothetical protein [Microbacterium sp. T2.11-28]|uniref:hypothetical protein n=1 Tax=Microbacterium sp. T2.11-28 TaxID=3041169 RepID=UPI002540EEB1|nr:hypothetical protein [Microbacterium sp. T2.11-28]
MPVLHPTEFELLVFMCLTALDADNPPRYFDSREAQALALGRIVPDPVDPDDETYDDVERQRTAAFQRVKVAVRGLVALRAIHRDRAGGNGRRATYSITLNALATQSTPEYRKRVRRGTSGDSPRGTSNDLVGVRRTYELGDAERTPYEKGGVIGATAGTNALNGTTSLGPVDNSERAAS